MRHFIRGSRLCLGCGPIADRRSKFLVRMKVRLESREARTEIFHENWPSPKRGSQAWIDLSSQLPESSFLAWFLTQPANEGTTHLWRFSNFVCRWGNNWIRPALDSRISCLPSVTQFNLLRAFWGGSFSESVTGEVYPVSSRNMKCWPPHLPPLSSVSAKSADLLFWQVV